METTKMETYDVTTFVLLCRANAELGTSLVKALTEQDERYEQKSAELEALKAEFDSLKNFDKGKFQDVNQSQANQIRELCSQNIELKHECAELKRTCDTLKYGWEKQQVTLSVDGSIRPVHLCDIQSVYDELAQRLDVTNEALKEKVSVMEAMDRRNKGMLSQLQDLRSDAQEEIDKLNERIASYEQDIAAHKDRWSLLRDRLQLLRDRMSQNAGNVADCINYLDAFVGEVANDTTH